LGGKQAVPLLPVRLKSEGDVRFKETINLKAGYYDIVVECAQGGGGFGLTAGWQGPNIPKQEIPGNVLFHASGTMPAPMK